jgi:dipeptidyl aminopeptidase/acylaminoacyl peptidase
LISINADGSDQKYLFGFRGPGSTGTHLQAGTRDRSWASVIDPLLDDPEHALVLITEWDGTADSTFVYSAKINLSNGLLSSKIAAPVPGDVEFLADRSGDVRYAVSGGANFETPQTFEWDRSDKKWHAIEIPGKASFIQPIKFSIDNSKVYIATDNPTGRKCLIEEPITTGTAKTLSCDDVADVHDVIFSFDGGEPIAAVYQAGKPKTVILNNDHADAKVLQQLLKSFPDRAIDQISTTRDGSKVMFRAFSDRDPGEYFLFDPKTMKAQSVAVAVNNIDPEEMAERRPISFKNRDGMELHGFLTIPHGKELKNLPLVVHPHGGPLHVEDEWEWDRESQMLANHGYAVMQVNFRGSGGFGDAFFSAGVQAWDTGMINDITDSARWAVKQGYADEKRLCIYGASYGGYAAMMSAVREPDLYRCVIASAGLYDLNLMTKDDELSKTKHGQAFISDFIGSTPERLKAASPLTYIANLKSATMIVHGKADDVVQYSQAEALRKALDARKHPYEWLVKSGEGHGFYAPENRVELYTRILAFLDKNIGEAPTSQPNTTGQGADVAK